MHLSRFSLPVVFLLAFAPQSPLADEADRVIRNPGKSWYWGLTVEQYSLDKRAASDESIGDRATAYGFEGEYFFKQNISLTLGMSILDYDDKASFRQATQNQTTNEVRSSKSDARSVPIYSEIGYKRFFTHKTNESYVTARLGLSVLLDSSRSVPSCTNCASEDINIDGGLYAVLGTGLIINESWGVGFQYKNYLSGDISSVLGINVTFGY